MTANFVLNRVVIKNKDITPYEGWKGQNPNVNFLRTWGCLTKVNIPAPKKRKFGPKMVDCVFFGYAQNNMAYRFLVVKSDSPDVSVYTIVESRDALFFEEVYPMRSARNSETHIYNQSEIIASPEPNSEPVSSDEDNDKVDDAPRRSKRQRVAKFFGDDFIVYPVDDVPKILPEPYASPDAEYWKEAVCSAMDSIMSNGTWEITDCPSGCKSVGCKWIFKKKNEA